MESPLLNPSAHLVKNGALWEVGEKSIARREWVRQSQGARVIAGDAMNPC
jgi:hypothetical protein